MALAEEDPLGRSLEDSCDVQGAATVAAAFHVGTEKKDPQVIGLSLADSGSLRTFGILLGHCRIMTNPAVSSQSGRI